MVTGTTQSFLAMGASSEHCGVFNNIPGFYLLDASSIVHSQL